MHILLKAHIEKKEFDHGYLMAGDPAVSREASFEVARAIFQGLPLISKGNPWKWKLETHPDFFYQKYDLFGIKDSQELIHKASQTPFLGGKKVFIIEILSFSIESANALLKTMEEPFSGTHFFIIVPSLDIAIPTLRSRLTAIENILSGQTLFDGEKNDFYKKFMNNLPNKRMDAVESFFKDKQGAIEFLNGLEVFLAGKLEKDKIYSAAKSLEEIQKNKNLLFAPSASAKMVLEHLALTLPKIV